MSPKPCRSKEFGVHCNKTEIKLDEDGMLPLSEVSFNGKNSCEIRKLPPKIRESITSSLETLSGESYKLLEYTAENGLVLHDERASYHCTCSIRFLVKKPYIDLFDAIELLHAHLKQKSEQSAHSRPRATK